MEIPQEFNVTFTGLQISWISDYRCPKFEGHSGHVKVERSSRLFCREHCGGTNEGKFLLMQSQWRAVGHAEVDGSMGGRKLAYKKISD
jgi:hypothetical protein